MKAGGSVKFMRIYRGNPFFKDCYYRLDENGEKIYYSKIVGVMKEIGRKSDGISERNIREHRDALIRIRRDINGRNHDVNETILRIEQQPDLTIHDAQQDALKFIREAMQQSLIAKKKGEEMVRCFCQAIQFAKSQKILKHEKPIAAENKLISPEEIESLYGIKVGTLAQWRWKKIGPDYIKMGALVRYKLVDIEAYIEKQTRRCSG